MQCRKGICYLLVARRDRTGCVGVSWSYYKYLYLWRGSVLSGADLRVSVSVSDIGSTSRALQKTAASTTATGDYRTGRSMY